MSTLSMKVSNLSARIGKKSSFKTAFKRKRIEEKSSLEFFKGINILYSLCSLHGDRTKKGEKTFLFVISQESFASSFACFSLDKRFPPLLFEGEVKEKTVEALSSVTIRDYECS